MSSGLVTVAFDAYAPSARLPDPFNSPGSLVLPTGDDGYAGPGIRQTGGYRLPDSTVAACGYGYLAVEIKHMVGHFGYSQGFKISRCVGATSAQVVSRGCLEAAGLVSVTLRARSVVKTTVTRNPADYYHMCW
jgi:hypothetical protein